MARINDNYLRLKSGYLFSEIARRVKEFQGAHPDAKLIRLCIGGPTQPLPPALVAAPPPARAQMAPGEPVRRHRPPALYAVLTYPPPQHPFGRRRGAIPPA